MEKLDQLNKQSSEENFLDFNDTNYEYKRKKLLLLDEIERQDLILNQEELAK